MHWHKKVNNQIVDAAAINKVTPPVKTRAVLHSGISDVLQDMWHSCPKVFAIVVSVLPAVGPLPKALKLVVRRCRQDVTT